MFVYCDTNDSPRTVAELICRADFVENIKTSWQFKDEDDSCVIESTSNGHCVAVVYCVGDSVVGMRLMIIVLLRLLSL